MATHKEYGRLRGLIVSGCLVERYIESLQDQIPEVDRWLPFSDYTRIVDTARDLMGLKQVRELPDRKVLLTPSAYAYLKISEGCDQKCAFCAIPSFRGRLASRSIEENVADARRIAEQGVGEINIVSQDTTAYGRDRYGKPQLAKLLQELTKIDGPRWWRVLYLYPSILRDDVLDEMGQNERIAKYIDLPLQHMTDRMLRAMKRGINEHVNASCSSGSASAFPTWPSGRRSSRASPARPMPTTSTWCNSYAKAGSTGSASSHSAGKRAHPPSTCPIRCPQTSWKRAARN